MEQNIEDPVEIKVSKILARKVSRQSKNLRQEQISEGSVNRSRVIQDLNSETSVSAKLPKLRKGEIQLLLDSVSHVEASLGSACKLECVFFQCSTVCFD